jgi:hypothetical protein
MGPYRRRMATYRLYHLLVDRNQPVITIRKPSTKPINTPTFTLLINIPNTRPSTMAKIKAISPRLILGFLSMFIVYGFSFMVIPHADGSPLYYLQRLPGASVEQ